MIPIISIILFSIVAVFTFVGIVLSVKESEMYYFGISALTWILLVPAFLIAFPPIDDTHVEKGTAEYVETIHYQVNSKGDTTMYKTYQLQWKEGYKWDRPIKK